MNHPQGYPKFVSNSFVTTPDNRSLVQVYLGPFSTKTTLSGGTYIQPSRTTPAHCRIGTVSVATDTLYPFGDTLTTNVTSDYDFTYYVRIPSWVSGGTIAINGGEPVALAPYNGLQPVSASYGTTSFTLQLPADITIGESGGHRTTLKLLIHKVEFQANNSVAIHRGPLHYAFDIPKNQTTLSTNAQQPLAVDLEYDSTSAWQYAIDTSTLVFNNNPPVSGSLPSPVYDTGLPPLTITVLACQIEWGLAGDTFPDSPPENATCTGPATNITLWPYGVSATATCFEL